MSLSVSQVNSGRRSSEMPSFNSDARFSVENIISGSIGAEAPCVPTSSSSLTIDGLKKLVDTGGQSSQNGANEIYLRRRATKQQKPGILMLFSQILGALREQDELDYSSHLTSAKFLRALCYSASRRCFGPIGSLGNYRRLQRHVSGSVCQAYRDIPC